MKHIVCISGGMGSFAESVFCVEKYGKENVIGLFSDTLIEDEDLYRFLDECIEFLGIELIVLRDGRTPFDVFVDEKFMGNSRIDPCSKHLKRGIMKRYIRSNYDPKEIEIHVGIDYSESHRFENIEKRMFPYVYKSLLVENGLIIKKDFSLRFGIKPPRLYGLGLGHNNCGGFCVKAGLGHYKKLLEGDRDRFIHYEQKEQEVYDAVPNAKPFLKKHRNKVTHYITLKQFRLALESKDVKLTKQEEQEFGGCGCAI